MATISAYPVQAEGGPRINRLSDFPIEFQTIDYEYDDGGIDVNVQPCGVARWLLEYEGLTAAELQTLVNHYNLAKGPVNDFSFAHPRDGVTYTGVKYEKIEIPRHTKHWALSFKATLWKLM